jgi:hypothetical protein
MGLVTTPFHSYHAPAGDSPVEGVELDRGEALNPPDRKARARSSRP